MNIPYEWEVTFRVDVMPQPDDTYLKVTQHVVMAAREWLPEDFEFEVKPITEHSQDSKPTF